MKVLEIDTLKSLYKPLEVRIDGAIFRVKAITLDGLEHIQGLKDAVTGGSAAAIREMLAETLDGPLEFLGKLTVDKIIEIVEFAIAQTVKPEPDLKNAPEAEPRP